MCVLFVYEWFLYMFCFLLWGMALEVCKLSGHMLELFWGYLLGEPADFQCRRDLWGHRGPPPHDGSSDTSEKSPAPWPRQSRRRGAMRFRSGG